MIVIIDIGVGNVGSMLNMLRKVGVEGCISSDPDEINNSTALILPGVGAFDHVVEALNRSNLKEVIENKVLKEKVPFLGVCVGMQLLFEKSEEGTLAGLGWIPGEVKKFQLQNLKVPHMGWNIVRTTQENSLLPITEEEQRFYFVHSYHAHCDKEYAIGTSQYGYDFVCAVKRDNIFGVQFHPEKSHRFGMELFKRFAEEIC